MVGKIRRFLYVTKPKSADLLLAIISGLLAFIAFSTRNVTPPSPTAQVLESVAPIEVWCLFLFTYSTTTLFSSISSNPRYSIYSGGLGTFTWFSIVATLLLKVPFTTGTYFSISLYGVFAIFAMWSFLSAQEEQRLKELFGGDYRRAIEAAMFDQIATLQERVSTARQELEDDTWEGKQDVP